MNLVISHTVLIDNQPAYEGVNALINNGQYAGGKPGHD